MKPRAAFDGTIQRVDRLLKLYDVLRNRRQRGTRSDWARSFKSLMHWPQGELIHRVDGDGAILVLRGSSGLTASQFCHDELCELLRAALVASVSALDRYCHEVLVARVIRQIKRSERNWPPELRKVKVSLSAVKTAIAHAITRKGRGGRIRPRPMNIIRHALQEQFHRDLSLQGSDDIAQAFSMVGVKSLWTACEKSLGERPREIKQRLDAIVKRRNQIVHEGDIKRYRRGGKVTHNPIEPKAVRDDVAWLRKLVIALDGAAQ